MINLDTPTLNHYARLAFDAYYRDESLNDYIDEDRTIENLNETIYDDIRDLLHNGNEGDLWPTLDADECDELANLLHDGWMTDLNPLGLLSDSIANFMRFNALMKQYNITTRDELNARTGIDAAISDLDLSEEALQTTLNALF